MANVITKRRPQIIAAEINSIKDQAGRMLLYSSVEIERRLYTEYGARLAAAQDGSNSESIPNLSYTQAIILLGIPEAERENGEAIVKQKTPGIPIILGIPGTRFKSPVPQPLPPAEPVP